MSTADLRPTRATDADLPALIELLGETEGCAPLTVWSVPWQLYDYWLIRDEGHQGNVIAAGSLQPIEGSRRAEIRGLVVAESHRGQGLASRIVEHLCRIAADRQLDVVCITTSPGFFERHGFEGVAPDWLPAHRRDVECGDAPRVALRRGGDA